MLNQRVRDEAGGAVVRVARAVQRVTATRAVVVDAAFVLVICATHVLALGIAPNSAHVAWWWPLLVSIPATFVLFLRRHWPRVAFSVLLAVATGLTLLGLPVGVLNLAILVAIYSVCVRGGLGTAVLVGAIAMVYPLTEMTLLSPGEEIVNIIGSLVNLVVVIGWARAMRLGSLRSAQLEQTVALLDQARDQLAADAAVVERARIAREFHDIVSHSLSIVALRAGVARALVDRNPEHARETLRELEQTSSSALSEMRTMLGALRGDTSAGVGPLVRSEESDPADDRQPAPRLDRLEALVDSVREAGVTWRLERWGDVRELGSGIEMTAYRIVQEAMTNVLKHAGPGHARVRLGYTPAALRVEITNHVAASEVRSANQTWRPGAEPERGDTDPVSGHGLIGLRERVALIGGTLTAHPIVGGFHLAAVLPCPENTDLE